MPSAKIATMIVVAATVDGVAFHFSAGTNGLCSFCDWFRRYMGREGSGPGLARLRYEGYKKTVKSLICGMHRRAVRAVSGFDWWWYHRLQLADFFRKPRCRGGCQDEREIIPSRTHTYMRLICYERLDHRENFETASIESKRNESAPCDSIQLLRAGISIPVHPH